MNFKVDQSTFDYVCSLMQLSNGENVNLLRQLYLHLHEDDRIGNKIISNN